MGTGVSVLSALQKGLQGWIRTASTRRTVRRVKKPLRGFFRCAARVIHPRPPRTPVSNGYRSFCFICLAKGTQGWIRTATATTAASGRNREELLGLRPAGCACRPRHDAAAGSRDPGFFSARLAQSTRAHQKAATYPSTLRFLFITVIFSLHSPVRAAVLECCFAQ